MNLSDIHICFASAYAAEYGGNFIKMLANLAKRLKEIYGCRIHYIFPKQNIKPWMQDLGDDEIAFISSPYSSCEKEILSLIKKWHIHLIHSHFEGYDVAIAKAIKHSGMNVKMVWHLHDYLSLDKTGLSLPWLRKFLTNQKMWYHYGKWGKDAYFVGVSAEITAFVTHYRHHRFSYPPTYSTAELAQMQFPNATVILNGIDTSRLTTLEPSQRTREFSFLSFGGESWSKGIPTILAAAKQLATEHYQFRIIITRGYTTDELLNALYPLGLPDWLEIATQSNNVMELYSQADCYISASKKETMSMAIAEASICGLPVIQTDIPGTWWNSNNPSTYIFPTDCVDKLTRQMKSVIEADKNALLRSCKQTSINNSCLLSMDRWVGNISSVYLAL